MSIVFDRVMPFSALVGQEELKLSLLLLAVNPRLAGLLIRGEKGTAKSTAARGLASILPPVAVNDGCRFGCLADRPEAACSECSERAEITPVERRAPFETLPLGITEDQLIGTLDLEHALRHGRQRFAPGLLARVNNGVLYVDEVNLLEDPVVDLLLDVSALGANVVAREGVSFVHPSRFVLIGTMNPEEGELRPQLTDRFGLCVEVGGLSDPEVRADVVTRCLDFEADPAAVRARYASEEAALTASIAAARELLPRVTVARSLCTAVARLSLELDVAGHRADVLAVKAMATVAALDGRTEARAEDLERVVSLVYSHRLRRRPFEGGAVSADELRERALAGVAGDGGQKKKPGR